MFSIVPVAASVQSVYFGYRFSQFGSGRFAVHAVQASHAVRFGSVHVTLRFMRFGFGVAHESSQ